jgi:AraC family transcriptional regulator
LLEIGSRKAVIVSDNQLTLIRPAGTLIGTRDFSGFTVQERLYREREQSHVHAHEKALLCIVLQGDCTEQLGTARRHYGVFDSEFVPLQFEHALSFDSHRTRCLSLEIDTEALTIAREYGLKLGASVQNHGGVIMGLMMKVYPEFKRPDQASCLAVQGLTFEMLAHISRLHVTDRRSPPWMAKLRELLHGQFSEPLDICSMANELNVHPAHLSRQFRKEFGRTVGQYVRELRIRQAMLELSHSQASIADIGVRAGFADQSHFSRTFKIHTGRTPGEFRRACSLPQEVRDVA